MRTIINSFIFRWKCRINFIRIIRDKNPNILSLNSESRLFSFDDKSSGTKTYDSDEYFVLYLACFNTDFQSSILASSDITFWGITSFYFRQKSLFTNLFDQSFFSKQLKISYKYRFPTKIKVNKNPMFGFSFSFNEIS